VDNQEKREKVRAALRILTSKNVYETDSEDVIYLTGSHFIGGNEMAFREEILDILVNILVPDRLGVL
jgi:hypothetical protein